MCLIRVSLLDHIPDKVDKWTSMKKLLFFQLPLCVFLGFFLSLCLSLRLSDSFSLSLSISLSLSVFLCICVSVSLCLSVFRFCAISLLRFPDFLFLSCSLLRSLTCLSTIQRFHSAKFFLSLPPHLFPFQSPIIPIPLSPLSFTSLSPFSSTTKSRAIVLPVPALYVLFSLVFRRLD